MNKKALSPLIATVLLIAFAVALGAVVMNWSKTQLTPDDKPVIISSTGDNCRDVTVKIEKIGENPNICISKENTLEFMLENTGNVNIKKIKMTVIGTAGEPFNEDVPNSDIAPSDTKRFEFEYPRGLGTIVKVKLTPVIWGPEKDAYCINQTIETTSVRSC